VPVDADPIRVVKRSAGDGSTTGLKFSRPSYGCATGLTELGLYPAAALVRAEFVGFERAAYEFDSVGFKINSNTKSASGSKLTELTMAGCGYSRVTFNPVPNRAAKTAAFTYFIHKQIPYLGVHSQLII